MSEEEQELYYGLDPRAGLWLIRGSYIEAKERADENSWLSLASMRQIETSLIGRTLASSVIE